MLMGGCENANTNYSVNGTINNYDGETLILNYLTRQKIDARDTVTVAADGAFSFNGAIEQPGLYNIKGEKNQTVLLFLEPGSKINLDWDASKSGEYAISGNRESEAIHDNTDKVNAFRQQRNTLRTRKAAATGNNQLLEELVSQGERIDEAFTNDLKETINNEPNTLVGLLLLSSLNPSTEKPFYNTFLEKIKLQYPNSVYSEEFDNYVVGLNSKVNPPVVGEMAREIVQESPDGKVHKLSDLRGKYVDWPYHVSDLKFWSSKAARDYAVGSIPASFLVDPEGKIIGKNLRGPALDAKLSELLD